MFLLMCLIIAAADAGIVREFYSMVVLAYLTVIVLNNVDRE